MKIERALENVDLMFNRLKFLISDEEFLFGMSAGVHEEVTHDIEDAIRYSTDQDIQDAYPEIQYWTSILECNNKLLDFENVGIGEVGRRKINEKISAYSRILARDIDKKVRQLDLPDDISYVISENFNVFLNEASYFGELSDFQKELLDVYERRFFPCGWRGDFPKGKLIIFSKENL
ncbi:hypothetical protein [Acidovorax sp. LjRoot117]|uniref:hypothetical protein n=1 Tax=Acidovorax sp. LjRoot117 TaxID=3342255 RepID=UPI003ECD06F7